METPRYPTPHSGVFALCHETTRHARHVASAEARQAEFNDLDLWIDLARTVERAAIDAAFFADVIGPSRHIAGPSASSSRARRRTSPSRRPRRGLNGGFDATSAELAQPRRQIALEQLEEAPLVGAAARGRRGG